MNIAIIGSGNVATFYGKCFQEQGHTIQQIFSPDENHARTLAETLSCSFTNSLHDLVADADIYLLAIRDNALKEYVQRFPFKSKTVIFTSGSVSLSDLQGLSDEIACIWCLYSIQKEQLPQDKDIPIFIQGNSEQAVQLSRRLAESISHNIQVVNDEQKLVLHLSAVLCNNFSNHLATMAQRLLSDHQLSFTHLRPIIAQTAEKIQLFMPSALQTGPAIRHDTQVLEKQMAFLADHPEWQKIYQLLSSSIMAMYPLSERD